MITKEKSKHTSKLTNAKSHYDNLVIKWYDFFTALLDQCIEESKEPMETLNGEYEHAKKLLHTHEPLNNYKFISEYLYPYEDLPKSKQLHLQLLTRDEIRDGANIIRLNHEYLAWQHDVSHKLQLEIAQAKALFLYEETLLKKIQELNEKTDPSPSNQNDRTRQAITNHLEKLGHNEGWEYAFNNEEDFNTFLDLLTNYFEYKPYKIPEHLIKIKRNCKTGFAMSLNPIHKELSEKPLKSDREFFKIIRCLSHFHNLSDSAIYKALTK